MLITSQEERNSRANISKPSYRLNKMQAVAGKCVTRNKQLYYYQSLNVNSLWNKLFNILSVNTPRIVYNAVIFQNLWKLHVFFSSMPSTFPKEKAAFYVLFFYFFLQYLKAEQQSAKISRCLNTTLITQYHLQTLSPMQPAAALWPLR